MSALDDKDVPSAEQWRGAVEFMTSALRKQIKVAEEELEKLRGPTSTYDRWMRWKTQSPAEVSLPSIKFGGDGGTDMKFYTDNYYYIDRGSLSTNHELASQNSSSNVDVSTAGLQSSSGRTSMQCRGEIDQEMAAGRHGMHIAIAVMIFLSGKEQICFATKRFLSFLHLLTWE